MNYYDGDLATSVVTLFPDVGFEISKFKTNGGNSDTYLFNIHALIYLL